MNTYNIPRQFTKGDYFEWVDSDLRDRDGNYLNPDEWLLTYHIRGQDVLDLSGTTTEKGWEFSATLDLLDGDYQAQVAVYNGVKRKTLGFIGLAVLPDLSEVISEFDPRSESEKILHDIRSAIASAVSDKAKGSKVQEYEIGTRKMKYEQFDQMLGELRRLERYYAWRVARERNQGGINQKIMRFGTH